MSHLVPAETTGDLTAFFAHARSELRRASAGRPLLVAVDDAHELDDGSASLVQQLLLHGEARLAMTVRAGATPSPTVTDIWTHDDVDRLDLEPLPRDATARLAVTLLGGDIVPRLEDEVWRLSRGHPLYVTVALDAARDHGQIQLDGDVWRVDGELVSARLVELVLSRTRDLADDERGALHTVALGEPLREDDLLAVVDGDVVARLSTRGLVTSVHLDGRRHITTSHPLRDHAVALAAGDTEALVGPVAQRFASAGATLFAGEAVAQAAAVLERAGDLTEARRTAHAGDRSAPPGP